MRDLGEREIERFSRQIILPEVGGRGQAALGRTRATVLGSSGAAQWCALYLAAAGVGELEIVFPGAGAGVLAERLRRFDPDLQAQICTEPSHRADVLVDASDHGSCHPRAHHASRNFGTPLVVVRFSASSEMWLGVFEPCAEGRPCPFCAPVDILPTTAPAPAHAALAGTLASLEAVRLVLRAPAVDFGRWRRWDLTAFEEACPDSPVVFPPRPARPSARQP